MWLHIVDDFRDKISLKSQLTYLERPRLWFLNRVLQIGSVIFFTFPKYGQKWKKELKLAKRCFPSSIANDDVTKLVHNHLRGSWWVSMVAIKERELEMQRSVGAMIKTVNMKKCQFEDENHQHLQRQGGYLCNNGSSSLLCRGTNGDIQGKVRHQRKRKKKTWLIYSFTPFPFFSYHHQIINLVSSLRCTTISLFTPPTNKVNSLEEWTQWIYKIYRKEN